MRFAILGSGSKGNATLVQQGNTRVLVDCGFSAVEVERRLLRVGCDPADIDALLLTHEHGDHLRGACAFAARHGSRLFLTHGTARSCGDVSGLPVAYIAADSSFTLGDLEVQAYTVPHDADEPCQYVFSNGASRIGMLSDCGRITPHIVDRLQGCDALLLESNHDIQMLMGGAYPQSLKQRISGDFGHLSNDQACALLRQVDCSRLSHIVAIHLSEQNNDPARVVDGFSAALGCEPAWVAVADQVCGLGWRTV